MHNQKKADRNFNIVPTSFNPQIRQYGYWRDCLTN